MPPGVPRHESLLRRTLRRRGRWLLIQWVILSTAAVATIWAHQPPQWASVVYSLRDGPLTPQSGDRILQRLRSPRVVAAAASDPRLAPYSRIPPSLTDPVFLRRSIRLRSHTSPSLAEVRFESRTLSREECIVALAVLTRAAERVDRDRGTILLLEPSGSFVPAYNRPGFLVATTPILVFVALSLAFLALESIDRSRSARRASMSPST